MDIPFSSAMRVVLSASGVEAQKLGRAVIWPEHVFAMLCKESTIITALKEAGISANRLSEKLYNELEKRSEPFKAVPSKTPANVYSLSLQPIFREAYKISKDNTGVNCIAMFQAIATSDTTVGNILRSMSLHDLDNKISVAKDISVHSHTPDAAASSTPGSKKVSKTNPYEPDEEETEEPEHSLSADLPDFCTDLVALGREGKLEQVIGRDSEIESAEDTLQRHKKRNLLLVGHAGVGKTAIAEGLAWRIANGKASPALKDKKIYSLNPGMIEADTENRGEFEKKFGDFLKKVAQDPDVILFLDEAHTFVGLGATSSGGTDAFNMLKPYMTKGDMSIIAATTFTDRKRITKDPAIERRFETIVIDEPSIDDAIAIVTKSAAPYEKAHGVKYSPAALRAAAILGERYLTGQKMPDKVFDLLDKAGVVRKKMPGKGSKVVTVADIQTVIARRTGIDVTELGKTEFEKLISLESSLRKNIVGQEEAITALADAARMTRSPLRDQSKPASLLFQGPTGVGKTEAVKQLAATMHMNLKRLDMSEMMEAHSVSKLIGAPPGYVGYSEGAQLTDEINQNPYTILLLDEIDKAHPDVLNIMLQAMDNGFMTDSEGNKINFRNTIIIMTTNAGVAGATNTIGFTAPKSGKEERIAENAKDVFTPEFLNRFDDIITFHYLQEADIPPIANKFLLAAQARMDELNIKLDCQDSARNWLIENGFSRDLGARPLKRLIEKEIMRRVNNAFMGGELKKNGTVTISFNEAAATKSAPLQFEFKGQNRKSAPALNAA